MNKVWTYIISRKLSTDELSELQREGEKFVGSWTAHEQKLVAHFEIFKERIIVIRVNEDISSASGCSIDKLLRFVKEMQSRFNIELLNRLLVAIKKNDQVDILSSSEIKQKLQEGLLGENTVIYNTAISSEAELKNWELPLKESWLNKFLVKS